MAEFDLKKFYGPLPFPRRWFTQDISSDAFSDDNGFVARANEAGTVDYIDFDGVDTKTQTVAIGDYIGFDSRAPNFLRRILATGTVGSVEIAYYNG